MFACQLESAFKVLDPGVVQSQPDPRPVPGHEDFSNAPDLLSKLLGLLTALTNPDVEGKNEPEVFL